MKELLKVHQADKQKYAQAIAELDKLQLSENELKGKINILASNVLNAEQMIARALTNESLEKARAEVEAALRKENDAKTLLSNTQRAIRELKEKLPALHNDVLLAEQDIWKAQQERLIQEIKTNTDVLRLIMKAYTACWQIGYRWKLEEFIREKILNADFCGDPDILISFKDEMVEQIWTESKTQASDITSKPSV
ncbi:hypothetical protein [Nitrosomonas marina]|uniref:Uncharacterized protein n=1 Tax=Nitrosomonas marina TaxID=917 RepID=A0A1H8FW75_9PROT|nr:hypothetical protein [Nitrosomonas marina]SEN35976.1 hypothetical protein SAMN05216325_11514 [Nitrosomonas marina]